MGPKREARLPSNSSRIEFASADDDDQKSARRRFRIQKPCLTRAGFALGLSLATVVVIVVSMTVLSREKSTESPFSKEKECSFSEEAKRVGLDKFLDKLRDEFQKHHPSFIAQKPGVTSGEVREIYRPYDFRPEAIKNVTDTGAALFKELQSTVLAQVVEGKLKLRERKAIHVARAVLKIAFGWSPLEGNYYLGDWLLGPNIFCWQPICDALTQLGAALPHFKPSNFNDLQNLFRVLELHRSSTYQYRENLKLAVKIGMVRPKEACKAGVREFKMRFLAITLPNETGIMGTQAARTLLSKEYLQRLKPETRETWIRQRNETVEQSLRHATIEFLWKPLIDLLRYLETDYIHHCAPSNVSSGLSSLPHPFVYASGQVLTDQPTTQKLPSGERLNGRDTYQKLVSAFTTLDLSPRELRDTAQRKLNALLSQIVTLAKQYTSERNATKAILDFRATLSSREMFYNQKPFPKNESGERAFRECATEWGARTFCPARWKAMLAWIKATYQAMDYLRPEMSRRFYTSGPKRTIPDCRIRVAPWFHADAVYHSYGETKSATCSINSALQLLPFFIDDFGPRFTEWTTTAHEQLPGHHLEVRSYIENFRSNCADAVSWLSRPNYFAGFTEGWATYAEFPLMSNDTDIYSNLNNKETLLQKYGVLRYQIYAALRSLADVEINYYGTSRDEVMRLYDKYAWVTSDLASKDVTRIQSCPGIVTSYMTGQMTFLKARDVMEKSLGSSFSLPEFHYEVLRQGEIPLDYLIKYIKDISKR